MENQILYGVGKVYGEVGKIIEFIVIKEMPKTYIVKGKDDFSFERRVKKENMIVGLGNSFQLVKSYSEAVTLAKTFLRKRIEINNNKVEAIKKDNLIYIEKLKELEGNNERT